MEIRELQPRDIKETVELWYETSLKAHDFISPDYWRDNKINMVDENIDEIEYLMEWRK
jgi:putative acetyltransferase